jgi:hypothetical protein
MIFGHLRTSILPNVENAVLAAVAQKNEQIRPVLDLLKVSPYREMGLTLSGGRKSTQIAVKLIVSGSRTSMTEEIGNLNFEIPHENFHGALDLTCTRQSSWSNILVTELSNARKPMVLFDSPVGDDDFYDEYNRLTGHINILNTEYREWVKQFKGLPDAASVAGHYSSTVRAWLAAKGTPPETFMRRPRAPYTMAMSPALNLALTIALQLRGGIVSGEEQE